jgi:hypothetical protein
MSRPARERAVMPWMAGGVIDSDRRLTPTRALPLRCRLASAEMRSDHLLCMDPDDARCLL